MDVRYQIFVSSTYEDLRVERADVMQALLELTCIPAGMELFPAASEEQWSVITRAIDDCDYYLVIIAGKYGSIHPATGQSYTEMEYRYAMDSGKPCIAFILDKSVDLPVSKTEADPASRAKLEAFKGLAQTKLCKFWHNSGDLGAKVMQSVIQLIRRTPATGWIRADAAARSNNEEVLTLKNQILELERTLDTLRRSSQDPAGGLARDDDEYKLIYQIKTQDREGATGMLLDQHRIVGRMGVSTTWNEIASAIGPVVIESGSLEQIEDALGDFYSRRYKQAAQVAGIALTDDMVTEPTLRTMINIKHQFVALGYITLDVKEARSGSGLFVTGRTERWIPTQEGMIYFGRQTAIKRLSTPPASPSSAS
jgi:hypothetical protein